MSDEEAGRLSESLKAVLKSLLGGGDPGRVQILPGEESQCFEILERRRDYRAER